MNYIHETIIRDIADVIEGIKDTDEIERFANRGNKSSFKSITSRSEALTMVFPVICSRNMEYSTAAMICKATERKAVTLLTMLFSAANMTNADNGEDYISKFHTNLKVGRLTLDDFMNTLDNFVEENVLVKKGSKEWDNYKTIQEDLKSMNMYFENNVNDESLNDYKIVSVGETSLLVNTHEPINEARSDSLSMRIDKTNPNDVESMNRLRRDLDNFQDNIVRTRSTDGTYGGLDQRYANIIDRLNDSFANKVNRSPDPVTYRNNIDRQAREDERQARIDDQNRQNNLDKNDIERAKLADSRRKTDLDMQKYTADIYRNRLVNQDIKKANELVPTLMYVNFVSTSNDEYPIYSSMVIGVKAKLYAVDGNDIMDRIRAKNSNNNLLLNLVKASTREISFFRDFLFMIDKAKVDALAQSRRGSSSKLWKVLERRATKSRFRRLLSMNNDATAITTLCLTQEEVEYMKKAMYLDVEKPEIIRPIMESYNLMGFVIADESLEICKFIYDTGDDLYEILTYDNLEKEAKDNSKKIINLMSKMNR